MAPLSPRHVPSSSLTVLGVRSSVPPRFPAPRARLATRRSLPHPTPPSLPRYASVTLLAGRWPLSSPRGGGSSAVRREPTTPVRLASPLATLVPPGRRALRAAYGECDEALRRPATEPGPRRDPPFLVTHFGSLLVSLLTRRPTGRSIA